MSAFIIAYKEADTDEVLNDDVFEFIDKDIIKKGQWVLKVKESAILRIFPYLMHRLVGRIDLVSNHKNIHNNSHGNNKYSANNKRTSINSFSISNSCSSFSSFLNPNSRNSLGGYFISK